MSYFAVHYSYTSTPGALDELRPEHRAFLNSLTDGPVVASGPYVGVESPAALLIVKAASAREVEDLLDQDPFWAAGLIEERIVTEWNPLIGIHAAG